MLSKRIYLKEMDRDSVLKQINEIFIDVIDNKELLITDETTARDVDGWNSLTHIELVDAIENHFRIRFTLNEIGQWKNVGQIIESVLSKKK